MKEKKKFKDTKAFSIIRDFGIGLFNTISPIPIKRTLDRNGDGKVNISDLKEVKPMEVAAAVGMLSFLLYFEIISIENLLKLLAGVLGN